MLPMILENFPRWKGPRWKCPGQMTPMAIGIVYEMYNPMVAMDVAALKATAEPRDGRPRMNASVAANTMVLHGL